MADKVTTIRIESEADLEAFIESKAALNDLSTSGIKGMNALRERVIELQKTVVNNRQAIETNRAAQAQLNQALKEGTINAQQHAQMLGQLQTREKELTASVQQSTFAFRTASGDLKAMSREQGLAMEHAQGFANMFGVQLPGEIGKFLTRIPMVQGALSAAFNVTVIGIFAQQLVELGVKMYELWSVWSERRDEGDSLWDAFWGGPADKRKYVEGEMDKVHSAFLAEIAKLRGENALHGLSGVPLLEAQLDQALKAAGDKYGESAGPVQTEILNKYAGAIQDAIIEANKKKLEEAKKHSDKYYAGLSEETQRENEEYIAREAAYNAALGRKDKADIAYHDRHQKRILEETQRENDEMIAREVAYNDALGRKDKADMAAAETHRRLAEERARQIEQEGNQLEAMYDRIAGKTKDAASFMKAVWAEYADYIKHQFFQGLAGIMMGQPGAGGAAAAGGGGTAILGSIFGAGLGAGLGLPGAGGTGGAATPPFFGGNFLAQAGGLGMGGGAGAATAQQAGMGNIAGSLGLPPTTPIGNILGKIFSHGAGPLSGTQLAMLGVGLGAMTIGNHSRVISGLGGAASGAMIGSSINPGIGTAVGALIGGLVGLFSGGGGGGQKQHDAALENEGFARMNQVLDDYMHQRRDYASAVDQENQLWNSMASQFQRADSAISQRPYFDAIIRSMQQTEDERNRRRDLMSLGAVPEFAEGGYVGSGGGTMLARLHAGEFVMTRQAVDRIGASVLAGLNQGGSSSAATASSGDMVIPAAAATQQWFQEALDKGIPVILRRGGAASRVLRG